MFLTWKHKSLTWVHVFLSWKHKIHRHEKTNPCPCTEKKHQETFRFVATLLRKPLRKIFNTGEQCCFVIKIDIAAGTATGINAINAATIDANAPAYNLAGQKVDKSFKGVVIQNGKKMIQK